MTPLVNHSRLDGDLHLFSFWASNLVDQNWISIYDIKKSLLYIFSFSFEKKPMGHRAVARGEIYLKYVSQVPGPELLRKDISFHFSLPFSCFIRQI